MSDTHAAVGETPPVVDAKVPDQTPTVVEPKEPAQEPEKKADTQEAPKETPSKVEPLTIKDIQIPEGFKADEKQLGAALELFNNPEIPTKDKFQSLVSMYADGMKQLADHNQKVWTDTKAEWAKQTATDKDLGSGDPKSPLNSEAKATIAKVLDQLGVPGLREALALTGAGDNPVIQKAFFKMGPLLTEGKFAAGNPPSTQRKGPGAHAMYPGLPEG